jgi:NAD-dependent dihydropyrimidine dehydrogenase PreA subunit
MIRKLRLCLKECYQDNVNIKELLSAATTRRQVIVEGQVVPEPTRCVQCGVCMFHCPIGIDIRRHAWLGIPIKDSRCLTCGECVARCPRGVLTFERSNIFKY